MKPGTVDVELELPGGAIEVVPIPRLLVLLPSGTWAPAPYSAAGGLPKSIEYDGRQYDLDDAARDPPRYVDAGPARRR